ncbi:MAG: alkaline phosphatase family protein [Rikenellaceae bacterium]|jgi:hypothetical protein|nr:alkaline phosphatase family protein [Rikenellaceae bacterium]
MKAGRLLLFSIFSLQTIAGQAQTPRPRLVVQIVVSQMRYDYLERFGPNFSDKGIGRLMKEGVAFTDFRYDYMLTTTPTSLATLTTGAMPSTHGVTGEQWVDFLTGQKVSLIEDKSAQGWECDAGLGCYSPVGLVVPTLADRLLEDSPESKAVTIASSPLSAVVAGGFTKEVYWCDESRGKWISSSYYMPALPKWVTDYNAESPANKYAGTEWELCQPREKYVNDRYSVVRIVSDTRLKKVNSIASIFKKEIYSKEYPRVYHTPDGNTLVKDFAKKAVVGGDLGLDESVDLLTVCFDASRAVGQAFGPESMEVEDMLYRLDADIADLLEFLNTIVGQDRLLVVLTSDHGASDSFDKNDREHRDRFNVPQFKVIMNGFMNAQYGDGDWVQGYHDRQLYLNRDHIYKKSLNLQEVQNRVAAFALQFRGVSHTMTSTALSSSSFAHGYGRLMQNSYYPRRSGDVVINLMQGWIEERADVRSLPGSMYDYDRHVPLLVLGAGLGPQRIRAPVDATQLAPTLARLMRINRPVAADGDEIDALTDLLNY